MKWRLRISRIHNRGISWRHTAEKLHKLLEAGRWLSRHRTGNYMWSPASNSSLYRRSMLLSKGMRRIWNRSASMVFIP